MEISDIYYKHDYRRIQTATIQVIKACYYIFSIRFGVARDFSI